MSGSVELTSNGPVAVLRLYKPPVNALDEPCLRELGRAAKQIEEDPAIRAVIVASGLDGVFCAGGDLKYWPRVYRNRPYELCEAARSAFAPIEQMTKPTVAAIQGHVIGDGLSLALACDIRLASQGVMFHLPEIEYGFIPGWGTIGRLVEAVGTAAATELLLVGEPMDAIRARALGLVNRVTAPDELVPAAEDLAARLAAKPPIAMRHAKAALFGDSTINHQYPADWESRCFAAVWGSPECERGIRKLFGANTVTEREEPHEGLDCGGSVL